MLNCRAAEVAAHAAACRPCSLTQRSAAGSGAASTSGPVLQTSPSSPAHGRRRQHIARAAPAPALEGFDVTRMQPLGDRLLVKPLEEASTTMGGLIMGTGATKHIHDASIGKVLGIGEDVETEVKVGDVVVFSKYSTSDIKVPDGEVCFVAQKSILATLS